MIKITNGTNVFEVTNGAFDGIYSHQGYIKVAENIKVKEVKKELTEDEKFVIDLKEKPIAQWKNEEIKKFALINNINLSGTKNSNEAKKTIAKWIELGK